MTYEDAERKRAEFLESWLPAIPEVKAAITRAVMEYLTEGFRDRFTVIPDGGITELHCSACQAVDREDWQWGVGYHPSLDILIEQAVAHNRAKHGTDGSPSG